MPINLAATSTSQWRFDPSHLYNTPSSAEGTSFGSEFKTRRNAVNKMTEICHYLKYEDTTKTAEHIAQRTSQAGGYGMNGESSRRMEARREWDDLVSREFQNLPKSKDVLWTASTFFHRFYMRYSLSAYPYQEIAATCVYLALKVEDRVHIKAQNVARISKRIFGDQSVTATAKWESIIIAHEETVLEVLCYDLTLEQPLGALLTGFEQLKGWMGDVKADVGRKKIRDKDGNEGDGIPDVGDAVDNPGGKEELDTADTQITTSQRPIAGLPKSDKGKNKDLNRGNELIESVVLELAYVICHETITTPLCLVSIPPHIAAASLLLALSIILKVPPRDMLAKVDKRWVKAFQEGYSEQKSEKEHGKGKGEKGDEEVLRAKISDAIKAILLYTDKALIPDIFNGEIQLEDVEALPESAPEAIKEELEDPVPVDAGSAIIESAAQVQPDAPQEESAAAPAEPETMKMEVDEPDIPPPTDATTPLDKVDVVAFTLKEGEDGSVPETANGLAHPYGLLDTALRAQEEGLFSNPSEALAAAMSDPSMDVASRMSVEAVSAKPLSDLLPKDVGDQYAKELL